MKKIIALLAIAVALVASQTIYPTTMVITDITGKVVTMETSTGHIYAMDDADDWMVGDLVSLIMFDPGTPYDITDDIIISARYAGTF